MSTDQKPRRLATAGETRRTLHAADGERVFCETHWYTGEKRYVDADGNDLVIRPAGEGQPTCGWCKDLLP